MLEGRRHAPGRSAMTDNTATSDGQMGGFSAREREAMQQRAEELRAERHERIVGEIRFGLVEATVRQLWPRLPRPARRGAFAPPPLAGPPF